VLGMALSTVSISESEITAAYPDLETEDVREAIRYAAEACVSASYPSSRQQQNGPSRCAERLGRCPDLHATGTIQQALTRRPGRNFASVISSVSERKSSACVTIRSEPSAGRLGGKS
jgi:hypothetical protein